MAEWWICRPMKISDRSMIFWLPAGLIFIHSGDSAVWVAMMTTVLTTARQCSPDQGFQNSNHSSLNKNTECAHAGRCRAFPISYPPLKCPFSFANSIVERSTVGLQKWHTSKGKEVKRTAWTHRISNVQKLNHFEIDPKWRRYSIALEVFNTPFYWNSWHVGSRTPEPSTLILMRRFALPTHQQLSNTSQRPRCRSDFPICYIPRCSSTSNNITLQKPK